MLYCGLFILVVVFYSVNKPQFFHSTINGHFCYLQFCCFERFCTPFPDECIYAFLFGMYLKWNY